MNAYHSKVKAEEKRRRLVERREKLRRLLEGEKEAMEVCVHTFLTHIRKKVVIIHFASIYGIHTRELQIWKSY